MYIIQVCVQNRNMKIPFNVLDLMTPKTPLFVFENNKTNIYFAIEARNLLQQKY